MSENSASGADLREPPPSPSRRRRGPVPYVSGETVKGLLSRLNVLWTRLVPWLSTAFSCLRVCPFSRRPGVNHEPCGRRLVGRLYSS